MTEQAKTFCEHLSHQEIHNHWRDCFTEQPNNRHTPQPNNRHTPQQAKIWLEYNQYPRRSITEIRESQLRAMIHGGYLVKVDPPTPTEAGAQEYEEIMVGEETWRDINR